MSIVKFYNRLQSKMIYLMTFKNKSDEDAFKAGAIILIIVMLSGYAHFIYKNEYLKSEGILNDFIFMIILGLIISASLFLKILYKNEGNNNIDKGEAFISHSQELNKNSNLVNSSRLINGNIFDDKMIASVSEIIKENRMLDEFGNNVFGISFFSKTKSKTQLAIFLNLIKEDLFKEKYASIGDEKFLTDFFNIIKSEKITHQYLGQVKNEIILFKGKRSNKIFSGIDENSDYHDLYIKLKAILIEKST